MNQSAGLRAISPEAIEEITEEFFREGCARISGVFSPEEVRQLREKTDTYATTLTPESRHYSYAATAFVLRRCHEIEPFFQEMTEKSSVLRIVEAVLGKNARFNAMNVIRNQPGQAISIWHVDDVLEFPLPDDIARFDPRIRMPVFWMTVQVALSDIDTLDHGPTQFVPGSHYSGRHPITQENPMFEGREAIPVFCKAGDIYLTNHQCWHRGAPNLSERTRYVMQLQYAQRWADARFKGLA